MLNPEQVMQAAKVYVQEYRLSIMPVNDDKRPTRQWTEYRSRFATSDDVAEWGACNLAIVTGTLSGVIVVDCESREDAEWFLRNRATTPTMVQSRRGYHLYFKVPEGSEIPNAARVKDEAGRSRYDVRGSGGYIVAPPSASSGWKYQTVVGHGFGRDLPAFDPAWIPEPSVSAWPTTQYTDVIAYISKIRAVSGNGGHDKTWEVANILKESGMDKAEAMASLAEWNQTNADPPWPVKDLLHKIQDAYRRAG